MDNNYYYFNLNGGQQSIDYQIKKRREITETD